MHSQYIYVTAHCGVPCVRFRVGLPYQCFVGFLRVSFLHII